MPTITPRQKIEQVNTFGGQYVEVILEGDTYDDSYEAAKKYCGDRNKTFIHPFDDPLVIEGQATLAYEILEQTEEKIDSIIVPIGGGGLISCFVIGIISSSKSSKFTSPKLKLLLS